MKNFLLFFVLCFTVFSLSPLEEFFIKTSDILFVKNDGGNLVLSHPVKNAMDIYSLCFKVPEEECFSLILENYNTPTNECIENIISSLWDNHDVYILKQLIERVIHSKSNLDINENDLKEIIETISQQLLPGFVPDFHRLKEYFKIVIKALLRTTPLNIWEFIYGLFETAYWMFYQVAPTQNMPWEPTPVPLCALSDTVDSMRMPMYEYDKAHFLIWISFYSLYYHFPYISIEPNKFDEFGLEIYSDIKGEDPFKQFFGNDPFFPEEILHGSIFKHKKDGLKTLFIVFFPTHRGSTLLLNFNMKQHAFSNIFPYIKDESIHCGSGRIYETIHNDILDAYIHAFEPELPDQIIITGHSFGGTLATLAALDLAWNNHAENILLYSFAAIRLGSPSFCDIVNNFVPNSFRVFNSADFVPMFPPWSNVLFDIKLTPKYQHCGRSVGFSRNLGSYLPDNHREAYFYDLPKQDFCPPNP